MNERPPIDLLRLSELLDLYGPEPARFPDAERSAALVLLEHCEAARDLLRAAAALAEMLDGVSAPEPSAALRRAVAEIPLRHPKPAFPALGAMLSAWSPLGSVRRAMLSAMFILALGALSGVWSASSGPDTLTAEDDWGDLQALTFAANLDQELAP